MPEEFEPPVVAVVVTADSGAWLEDCLESLERQDYLSLDVLVVATGAAEGVTNRVASVMPGAFVRGVPADSFAAAANEVLVGIEGASFFLFCHDDVALDPGSVRLMVEEAFRSNAGIVGPKLVDWEDPRVLLQVGLGMNRFGVPVPRIQEGELDQEQHDEVREVFAVPSACLLARVDLFAAVGGFDAKLGAYGEDVDLCWRAQLAGARVVTAPKALVRHRQAAALGEREIGDELTVRRRNELRSVLKNYGALRRAFVALELATKTFLDSLTAPVTSRRGIARAERGAWRWNYGERRSLAEGRRVLRDARQVGDGEVAARMASRSRFQRVPPPATHTPGHTHHGSVWRPVAASYKSGRQDSDRLSEWLGRIQVGDVPTGSLVATVVIAFVLLLGIRNLIFGSLPIVGGLVPGPSGIRLLEEWIRGRSAAGWGSHEAGPPAFAVLGAIGTILGNSSAAAVRVVFLSGLVVGAVGVSRLVASFGSSRARIVAAVAFAGSPLVWNGLARGDLEAAAALAGLPFVFGRLARATGLRPFVPGHGAAPSLGWQPMALVAEAAPLGILLAVMTAVAPASLLDLGIVAAGMLLASSLSGEWLAALRGVVVASGAAIVAFACCLPWSLEWLQSGARWSLFAGPEGLHGRGPSAADVLRGHLGPVGGWWGAGGIVVLAAFVFVWAGGARLAWGTRWWIVALGATGLSYAGGNGWLGSGGGDGLLLAAPACVALAACCGLAAAAFELDVKQRRFGWLQLSAALAVACLVAGVLPALGSMLGGRGSLPAAGYEQVSGELLSQPTAARTLWIGDPRDLPGSRFGIAQGEAAFVTTTGLPSLSSEWPAPDPGPAATVAALALRAEAGDTLQLGARVAAYGIRYIAVPLAEAPVIAGAQSPPAYAPPAGLVQGLDRQADLRQLPDEDGVLVWENAAWTPSDGTGMIARTARGSKGDTPNPALTALAIAVLAACLAEGVVRRRRAPRRGTRGKPEQEVPPPEAVEEEVVLGETSAPAAGAEVSGGAVSGAEVRDAETAETQTIADAGDIGEPVETGAHEVTGP